MAASAARLEISWISLLVDPACRTRVHMDCGNPRKREGSSRKRRENTWSEIVVAMCPRKPVASPTTGDHPPMTVRPRYPLHGARAGDVGEEVAIALRGVESRRREDALQLRVNGIGRSGLFLPHHATASVSAWNSRGMMPQRRRDGNLETAVADGDVLRSIREAGAALIRVSDRVRQWPRPTSHGPGWPRRWRDFRRRPRGCGGLALADPGFANSARSTRWRRQSLARFEARPDAAERPEVATTGHVIAELEGEIDRFLREARPGG